MAEELLSFFHHSTHLYVCMHLGWEESRTLTDMNYCRDERLQTINLFDRWVASAIHMRFSFASTSNSNPLRNHINSSYALSYLKMKQSWQIELIHISWCLQLDLKAEMKKWHHHLRWRGDTNNKEGKLIPFVWLSATL